MLYALSLADAAIYSADARADSAPFVCPRCALRVHVRRSPHQRPHWVHARSDIPCVMRRDAGTFSEYRARVAQEIALYGASATYTTENHNVC